MSFQFIELSTEEFVKAVYEADEAEQPITNTTNFAFKELSNGKIVPKIAFVDADGNKIKLF